MLCQICGKKIEKGDSFAIHEDGNVHLDCYLPDDKEEEEDN